MLHKVLGEKIWDAHTQNLSRAHNAKIEIIRGSLDFLNKRNTKCVAIFQLCLVQLYNVGPAHFEEKST